jgi:hypothetical protein
MRVAFVSYSTAPIGDTDYSKRGARSPDLDRHAVHAPLPPRICYAYAGVSASASDDNTSPSTRPNSTVSSRSRSTSLVSAPPPEDSKEALVFDSIASSYDLMNDATSLGVHRLRKDFFVFLFCTGSNGPIRCIGVAGRTTGDVALRILDHARQTYGDRETRVDVVDINGRCSRRAKRAFKGRCIITVRAPFPLLFIGLFVFCS